ncbi:hypothetical protein E3N88_44176 [Mikania micrantha]|uniref:Uncharacterized protein n=1 Tax=Mikania micrantha TaxID=192012 RepID=A0A5N6LCU4_9ASTR|nr:hypothetical protein E3N88_44176 [Mikania micrantha]
MVKRVCDSKIGEYLEDETLLDSESSRRVLLMQKKYISYETLKRDLVPCGTPGASYYNCNGKGVAAPYNRGCEVITRSLNRANLPILQEETHYMVRPPYCFGQDMNP